MGPHQDNTPTMQVQLTKHPTEIVPGIWQACSGCGKTTTLKHYSEVRQRSKQKLQRQSGIKVAAGH